MNLVNKKNINWHDVSRSKGLSLNFIRKYQNKLNWTYISRYQLLPEDFIEEFQDKVNWNCISTHQKLSEGFIEWYYDDINWHYISQYQCLSIEFIIKFKDYVNWNRITRYQQSITDLIEQYNLISETTCYPLIDIIKDKLDWDCISKYKTLNYNFIIKHHNYLNWNYVSFQEFDDHKIILSIHNKLRIDNKCILYTRGIIDESFVDAHPDVVDWDLVSKYIQLSSKFINKYKNRVNWMYISTNQKYGIKFITKFHDKLHWYWVLCTKNINEPFVKKFHKKITQTVFSYFPDLKNGLDDFIMSLDKKDDLDKNDIKTIKQIVYNFKNRHYRNMRERVIKETKNDMSFISDVID